MAIPLVSKAHTPAMMAWAEKHLDALSRDQLIDRLVAVAQKQSAAAQAAAVMALCIVADRRMGDAWLTIGQFAHTLSMQQAEKYAIYGDKMYPLSEKQIASIVNAVIQAKKD